MTETKTVFDGKLEEMRKSGKYLPILFGHFLHKFLELVKDNDEANAFAGEIISKFEDDTLNLSVIPPARIFGDSILIGRTKNGSAVIGIGDPKKPHELHIWEEDDGHIHFRDLILEGDKYAPMIMFPIRVDSAISQKA